MSDLMRRRVKTDLLNLLFWLTTNSELRSESTLRFRPYFRLRFYSCVFARVRVRPENRLVSIARITRPLLWWYSTDNGPRYLRLMASAVRELRSKPR
jgi:hypothetical protein